jgi:hypothetical protein
MNADIPPYFLQNGRAVASRAAILPEHRLYRLVRSESTPENPLNLPNSLTAISCFWSAWVERESDLRLPCFQDRGNRVCWAIVSEVLAFELETPECWISLMPVHAPEPDNYAHAEILWILEHKQQATPPVLIRYADWQTSLPNKANKSWKKVRADFRSKISDVFRNPRQPLYKFTGGKSPAVE